MKANLLMNKQFRSITIDDKIDYDNQIISLTCASETPFERQDGKGNSYDEVLLIDENNIDMARLKSNCSILLNHNDEKILGQVLDAKIVDRKLVVRVQFRKNDPESVNMFKDVAEGIVKNVSIGYIVNSIEYKKEGNKTIGYVTSWMPFEVSVGVGVPADYTVGFYRSLTKNKDKNMSANLDELKKKLKELEEEIDAIDSVEEEVVDETDNVEEVVVENDNAETEEVAVEEEAVVEDKVEDNEEEEIKSIARAFGKEKLVKSALERKISAVEFKRELKSNITKKEGNIVMENRYDVTKLFRAAFDSSIDASFERQVSNELYRSYNAPASQNPKSFSIRAFNGTNGAGLIGTEQRPELYTSMLTERLALDNLYVLNGLVGNVAIPVQTSKATVTGTTVNGELASTAFNVESLTLSPKKMGVVVEIGKDLLAQGLPSVIQLVIDEALTQIAIKTETAIFEKLAITTGVNAVEIADVSAATFKNFVSFSSSIDGFALKNKPYFVMGSADLGTVQTTSKDVGSGRFICENDQINGKDVKVSGVLSSGDIYFGDFSRIALGYWGGINITLDDLTKAEYGVTRVIVDVLYDIAVRNPNAFAKRIDVEETSSGEA